MWKAESLAEFDYANWEIRSRENGLVLNGRGSGIRSFRGNPGGGEWELEEKTEPGTVGIYVSWGA